MKQIFLFVLAAFFAATSLQAQSPYGFRGPTRTGFYPESGLLKTWPEEGPQLLWETADVGKGYSSPVIVGDRLYVTGLNEDGNKEVFKAYTLDGKKVYETIYGTPWDKSYPDTRSTPTIYENKAFIISGIGDVACINITNGNIMWNVVASALGIKFGSWGASESPLVFDNKVIFTPCGDQTSMVALNITSGEIVWKTESLGDPVNYASPVLITHNGKKQIIAITGLHIIGVNPETGKIEWKFSEWGREYWKKMTPDARLASEESTTPCAPMYRNGRIFITSGYDFGSFMLQLNADATAVDLVWRNNEFDNHHGGVVLVNGTLYGTNWISNSQGNWMAVDWNSGATKYDTPWGDGKGKGAIITADNMLYCYDERRGTVGLVKPNPEKFDVVSEFRITKGEGPHWAHPVIDKGILYIRHGSVLMAYKIK